MGNACPTDFNISTVSICWLGTAIGCTSQSVLPSWVANTKRFSSTIPDSLVTPSLGRESIDSGLSPVTFSHSPVCTEVLRDYLKTEVATNDDTIREHSSVAASPSSSLPSSHTSQANLDTSRASPMFVRPHSDAPDSVSVLTRRASPLRSAGYAADSRIWRPSRGQWGCHIPYPDTDAEDSALLDEVAQPPLTPVSPPTAWHRGRSLPPPLCSVGHHLHLREYCAWFPASLGRSDCDRLHPPQTGFAH